MTVKELVASLIEYPMDAKVEIEVSTDECYAYSSTDRITTKQIDDYRVLIYEE